MKANSDGGKDNNNDGSLIDIFTLKALRKERGLDQKTLADKADIDPSILSRLERGLQTDLKASILVAIARALNVPVESLLLAEARSQPKETSIDYLVSLGLTSELAFVVKQLLDLPSQFQHHVAALLQAYIVNLPDVTIATTKKPTTKNNLTQLQEPFSPEA